MKSFASEWRIYLCTGKLRPPTYKKANSEACIQSRFKVHTSISISLTLPGKEDSLSRTARSEVRVLWLIAGRKGLLQK